MQEPLPTTRVAGRYELVRLLGHGSFGHTFLARDRESHRDVALKLLNPERADDFWKAHELLEREAAVLKGLKHPGIPAIYEVLRAEWQSKTATFLVMEFIEGSSLAEIIDNRQSLSAANVADLFLELLRILEYLHGRLPPILHRDIKPANIMVRPDGSPVLVDFGSVRHVFLSENESGSTIAGTYGYMPYEQYMGLATPASDLYALAATFLHLITGRPPREFINDHGRIVVPATVPGSSQLRSVIVRLLLPSPAERFASARDARRALLSASTADTNASGVQSVVPNSPAPDPMAQDRLRRLHESLADPTPRQMDSTRYALLNEMAPDLTEYMSSMMNAAGDYSPMSLSEFLLITVLTLGTYPLWIYFISQARRNRLERCFAMGNAVLARIERIATVESVATERVARVYYTFDAAGKTRSQSDRILTTSAMCWEVGDVIDIIHDPNTDESTIVSGR